MPVYGNVVTFETPSNKSDWISELTIVYDEVTYNLQYKYDSVMELVYFGNGSLLNIMGANIEDTGEPFGIAMIPDGDNVFIAYALFTNDTQETAHTLSISRLGEIIKTLDPKYIADMYYDARVRGYYSQAVNPNPLHFDNVMMNMSFYKVSNLVPTRTEIFNSTKVVVNGTEYMFTENSIQLETNDFVFVISSGGLGFIFVNKSGILNFTTPSGESMSFENVEKGIYYQRQFNAGVPEGIIIEFIIGELKQIDPKFIPADLDNYYTKNEISNVIANNLQRYYTKSEVDNAIEDAIENVSVDLSGYYTKDETYNKNEIDTLLDDLVGDIDTILDEISTLIGE